MLCHAPSFGVRWLAAVVFVASLLLGSAARAQDSCGVDVSCWKTMGVGYAAQARYDQAEEAFHKACELGPQSEDACLYYGRTLYLLNRFESAITVLRRSSKAGPSSEAHRIIALSLEGLGRASEAEKEFRMAIKVSDRSAPNEDPGIDFGVFLFRQGRAEPSLAPLEAALQRHPDSSRAHLELGRSLLSLDRLDAAASHLEKAVALNPGSSRAHLLLGKVYQRLGKPELAAEHLRQGSLTAK